MLSIVMSAIMLAMFAYGVWMISRIVTSGEYPGRFGGVIERSLRPTAFWIRTIALSVGTLMIGLLGVVLAWSAKQTRNGDRRIDDYLRSRRNERAASADNLRP
jgi:hypothetical protein